MPQLAIIGGGILGTTIAYWLSTLFDGRQIVVIEKEADVAAHMSGRNTGVIHRPFYLDPEQKRVFADAVTVSYPLWKEYARVRALPWKEVGTLEVALDDAEIPVLETYLRWASANGIPEGEVRMLSGAEAKRLEPNVVAKAALLSATDTAVDFGLFTKALRTDAAANGVSFLCRTEVSSLEGEGDGLLIRLKGGAQLKARYLINCAGGGALSIARMAGVAKDLAALNFRGEYWRVTPAFSTLASRNIYSVPRHREMPFLDPHWVVRWDGSVSIGPTAIPVLGPYTYDGFAPSFSGLQEALQGSLHPNVLKLMGNSAFWRLAGAEWKSALSREEMAKRVARFIPAMKPGCLAGRGLAGVRSSIIDKSGEFVKEALEIAAPHSFHILNYNSPGATGAPAYAARIVKIVLSGEAGGFLVPQPSSKSGVWDYQGIASRV